MFHGHIYHSLGPYGDPNRWDQVPVGNLTWLDVQQGEFPRTMSMFRTSYSFVTQVYIPLFLVIYYLLLHFFEWYVNIAG